MQVTLRDCVKRREGCPTSFRPSAPIGRSPSTRSTVWHITLLSVVLSYQTILRWDNDFLPKLEIRDRHPATEPNSVSSVLSQVRNFEYYVAISCDMRSYGKHPDWLFWWSSWLCRFSRVLGVAPLSQIPAAAQLINIHQLMVKVSSFYLKREIAKLDSFCSGGGEEVQAKLLTPDLLHRLEYEPPFCI